jgi:hypothetical protein
VTDVTTESKTRLRKIDTINKQFAVVTYEATRDGVVLGTVTKYDEPAHTTVRSWKSGRPQQVLREYREIYWACDPDPYREGYRLRSDCVKALERIAGVVGS